MFIESLRLFNFRCFKEVSISFKERINIIYGNNAQGKTSILEAIYLLSGAKSFRTSKNLNIINFFIDKNNIENKASVFAQISSNVDNNSFSIGLILKERGKEFYLEDLKKTPSDYYGKINCISFSPDDSEIIKGSPQIRRSLIDKLIVDLDINKLKLINSYQKAILSKNKILKENKNISEIKKEIRYWNEILHPLMKEIAYLRIKTIDSLNKKAIEKLNEISSGNENLKIVLNSKLILDNSNDKLEVISDIEIKNNFEKIIDAEIKAKRSLFGSHLDDLVFQINNTDSRISASQGQIRSIILAVKLSTLDLLKEQGIKPIILLDDLDAEFDKNRLKLLANLIKLSNSQVFISTTNPLLKDLFQIESIGMFEVTNFKVLKS